MSYGLRPRHDPNANSGGDAERGRRPQRGSSAGGSRASGPPQALLALPARLRETEVWVADDGRYRAGGEAAEYLADLFMEVAALTGRFLTDGQAARAVRRLLVDGQSTPYILGESPSRVWIEMGHTWATALQAMEDFRELPNHPGARYRENVSFDIVDGEAHYHRFRARLN